MNESTASIADTGARWHEWACWVCLAAMTSPEPPAEDEQDRVCPSCQELRAVAGIGVTPSGAVA